MKESPHVEEKRLMALGEGGTMTKIPCWVMWNSRGQGKRRKQTDSQRLWIIKHRSLFFKAMLIIVTEFCSFLWLSNIPFVHVHISHFLIYFSVGRHLGYFHFLSLRVVLHWAWEYRRFFNILMSWSMDKKMKLLDPVENIFWVWNCHNGTQWLY